MKPFKHSSEHALASHTCPQVDGCSEKFPGFSMVIKVHRPVFILCWLLQSSGWNTKPEQLWLLNLLLPLAHWLSECIDGPKTTEKPDFGTKPSLTSTFCCMTSTPDTQDLRSIANIRKTNIRQTDADILLSDTLYSIHAIARIVKLLAVSIAA